MEFICSSHKRCCFPGTRLYVQVSEVYKKNVEGLCGNFDDVSDNEFIDLQNNYFQLTANAVTFGNRWRSNGYCSDKIGNDVTPCLVHNLYNIDDDDDDDDDDMTTTTMMMMMTTMMMMMHI